ncbi:sulfurtransferase complex subunit TusD [Sansalvadorimonas sp. 2012CJ34-2]|uniref:Sulfurtransferase complex subunit TusD n=1 Tax=Parendozoicomonas callyspongiae TaxID=2942213 RepID=A0ABT0PDI3_9GAMM|nr:sulfurtransferase complex subunit TusD [Sansalvadorimonas sp. 2012CJ34-2]MCL6268807.1 sulfurtransferase complex subunit TusD [Sansalvadorimonas sp. 2012CJ34-2]
MNYTLVIHGAPASSQSCQTALSFARAALNRGHKIARAFFFRDAVHIGSGLTVAPQGEADLHKAWKELAEEHEIDLVICISAALKRGLVDEREARRYDKVSHNIDAPFNFSGLGQLIDGAATSDHVITFGD